MVFFDAMFYQVYHRSSFTQPFTKSIFGLLMGDLLKRKAMIFCGATFFQEHLLSHVIRALPRVLLVYATQSFLPRVPLVFFDATVYQVYD